MKTWSTAVKKKEKKRKKLSYGQIVVGDFHLMHVIYSHHIPHILKACMCVYMHMQEYVCIHTCILYMYLWRVYECVNVCVCVYIYIYIYIYIYLWVCKMCGAIPNPSILENMIIAYQWILCILFLDFGINQLNCIMKSAANSTLLTSWSQRSIHYLFEANSCHTKLNNFLSACCTYKCWTIGTECSDEERHRYWCVGWSMQGCYQSNWKWKWVH